MRGMAGDVLRMPMRAGSDLSRWSYMSMKERTLSIAHILVLFLGCNLLFFRWQMSVDSRRSIIIRSGAYHGPFRSGALKVTYEKGCQCQVRMQLSPAQIALLDELVRILAGQ